MECLVCCKKIKLGEQIFWGNQVDYCGPGESDCSYSGASEGLVGGIHLLCLKSPAETTRTSNTVVPESIVVSRSDALGIFGD